MAHSLTAYVECLSLSVNKDSLSSLLHLRRHMILGVGISLLFAIDENVQALNIFLEKDCWFIQTHICIHECVQRYSNELYPCWTGRNCSAKCRKYWFIVILSFFLITYSFAKREHSKVQINKQFSSSIRLQERTCWNSNIKRYINTERYSPTRTLSTYRNQIFCTDKIMILH